MKVPIESYKQGKCARCDGVDSLDSMLRTNPAKGGNYQCKDCHIESSPKISDSGIEMLSNDNNLVAPTLVSKALRFMFG